jgi:hypothetical protein
MYMNFLGRALLTCTMAGGAAIVVSSMCFAAQKPQTFSGEISDRDCVEMAGHEMMLKKGETPKDCTITCVKLGSKYVLYDAESKAVYQLDDQKKPEEFAGSKVKVTGTYDAATKTIHVSSIQPAS